MFTRPFLLRWRRRQQQQRQQQRAVREGSWGTGEHATPSERFPLNPRSPAARHLNHSPLGISMLAIVDGGDEPAEFFATTLIM